MYSPVLSFFPGALLSIPSPPLHAHLLVLPPSSAPRVCSDHLTWLPVHTSGLCMAAPQSLPEVGDLVSTFDVHSSHCPGLASPRSPRAPPAEYSRLWSCVISPCLRTRRRGGQPPPMCPTQMTSWDSSCSCLKVRVGQTAELLTAAQLGCLGPRQGLTLLSPFHRAL